MFEQKVVPMEPRARSILTQDAGFFYQVKWDGIRLLAFSQGKKFRLQGRSLKDKTVLYPELACLPELVKGRSFILDGELVALKEKRPSFYTLMQRERSGSANIPRLVKLIPVDYMVFDILFFNDAWLLNEPWEARQEILRKCLVEDHCLHLTPSFRDGRGLLEAVKELGLEGVVAKKSGSPYVPGPRKSSYWIKTKLEQTLEAYAGGITLKDGRPASLLLGLDQENPAGAAVHTKKMRYIGSVSSGLKEKDLTEWYRWGRENSRADSPFFNPPRASSGQVFLWTEPRRKIMVSFNEWTPDLKLRAPRLASRRAAMPTSASPKTDDNSLI